MAAKIACYLDLGLYPLVSLFFSLVLTSICIRVLPRLGYMDVPGGRHIHKSLVPRAGGIAIIIAFFLSLVAYALHEGGEAFELLKRVFLPVFPLCVLGLIDDRRGLGSKLKLFVQIGVAVLVWYLSPVAEEFCGWHVPWFLSLGVTVFWVLLIINAFNLIDGLDGLASGLATVSCSCIAIWFLLDRGLCPEAVMMLILAGGCIGFLRYNFHPAKIFLGDTGSTFLGLIFAITSLSTVDKAVTVTSLLMPLLAIGLPLFDVFLAVWRRSTRKMLDPNAGGIMDGDSDHLHHRLLRATRDQSKTALVMYAIAVVFAALSLFFLRFGQQLPMVSYLLLLLMVLVMVRRLARVELLISAALINKELSRPRRGLLMHIVHPAFDAALLFIAGVTMSLLFCGRVILPIVFMSVMPTLLLLVTSSVYRVYWLRASIKDHLILDQILLLGALLSDILFYYFAPCCLHLSDFFLLPLLNLFLIPAERNLLHYVESWWYHNFCLKNDAEYSRILVYGGGLGCRLFVTYLFSATQRQDASQIVGILDDENALHGLLLYGFPVLGSADHIAEIYQRTPFDKVVITLREIPEDALKKLETFCGEKNLPLKRFSISEVSADSHSAR